MADNTTGYRTRPVSLSGRLQAISALAGTGNTVCDVGCDHAHIPIRLLQEKRFSRAIGMDVIDGPLGKAAGNLRLYGMEQLVELRLSDGLDAFRPGEADTLIIAGMGGSMIREILLREPEKTKSFYALVLGPQSDPDKVRSCLRTLGFTIEEERFLFEDGKYYPILRAVKSTPQSPVRSAEDPVQQAAEDLFGPVLLRRRDPVLHEYLIRQTAVLEKILRSVRGAVLQTAPQKKEEKKDLHRVHLERQTQIERDLEIFRAALAVYGTSSAADAYGTFSAETGATP